MGGLIFLAIGALALRADTVAYTYDAAGRLTLAQYSSDLSITYVYDAAGNLLSRTVSTPTLTPGSTQDLRPAHKKTKGN